eukprot:scaffold17260_cov36-Phaeocystis_antarctica.AAC.1
MDWFMWKGSGSSRLNTDALRLGHPWLANAAQRGFEASAPAGKAAAKIIEEPPAWNPRSERGALSEGSVNNVSYLSMAKSDDDDHAEERVRQALDLTLNCGHVTRDIWERLHVDSHLQACCNETLLEAFTEGIVEIDCGSVSEPVGCGRRLSGVRELTVCECTSACGAGVGTGMGE